MKKKQHDNDNIISTTRKAYHDYNVLEKIEAGIKLTGTEVKSCRAKTVNMQDSYVNFTGMYTAMLINTHISPYDNGNIFNHNPTRPRQLLMHRLEILKLRQHSAEKGLTVVPLRMYFKGSLIKIELGLCRGKSYSDKRETLKQKQDMLDVRRALNARR